MNAVGNMSALPFAFECLLSHEERTTYWAAWTEAKQRDVLSVLRIGERAEMVNDILAELRSDRDPTSFLLDGHILLNDRKFRHRDGVCPSPTELQAIYTKLYKIAGRSGVSRPIFEQCCTVPTKNGRGRVFYPYHVLSQSRAIAIGWNRVMLFKTTNLALLTMRTACNKPAGDAGSGEPQVNVLIYIYWQRHHICHETQQVITQRP